jgi:hypothetical protein
MGLVAPAVHVFHHGYRVAAGPAEKHLVLLIGLTAGHELPRVRWSDRRFWGGETGFWRGYARLFANRLDLGELVGEVFFVRERYRLQRSGDDWCRRPCAHR